MNTWTEKSFAVAKDNNYLDDLSFIYPVNQNETENRIEKERIKEIEKLLHSRNPAELIKFLIKLERFPFDDPYIGFIRHFNNALDKNPKTVDRIFQRLQLLTIKGIVEGINRPKSASRKFGNYFIAWVHKQYKTVSEEEFLKSKNKICALKGGDKTLALFAKKYLKYDRKKGLDFVLKAGYTYIIGEAKFVGHSGGTQDKSVREVISLVKGKKLEKVVKVGVVDGVPWVASSTLYKSLHKLKSEHTIVSALLFEKFIKSLH